MTRSLARAAPLLTAMAVVGACSDAPRAADGGPALELTDAAAPTMDAAPPTDAGIDVATTLDASSPPLASEAGVDAASDGGSVCSVDGNPGACVGVAACAALAGHTAFPGYCPGPADIECCAPTPDVASNPPTPTGYEPMVGSAVTPAMTAWAVSILDDPAQYPMFSTAAQTFGAQLVLARVEWHLPDFQNGVVHRGVTLYVPIPDGG